jgi:hypothetical protein
MKPLRQIKSLSISETRWLAYATAGVASAFGLSSSAEAEIHYSGYVNIKLTGNAQASLPLSNVASLFFENTFKGSTFLQNFRFAIKGAISGSAREGRRHHWLSDLSSRENVSGGRFYSVAGNPDHGIIFTFWSDGYFQPYYGTRGFIGFRFNTGNGTQYGWARIETRRDINNHAHETIKDYAWGDVGDVILTGQKHSLQQGNENSNELGTGQESDDSAPELESLGGLALGAVGLLAWRKRKQTTGDASQTRCTL